MFGVRGSFFSYCLNNKIIGLDDRHFLLITTFNNHMPNTFLDVLKIKNFQRIWFSQLFSQVALNMLTFALVLHIFDITGRTTSISLVMLVTAIPVALLGPFSGVFADKFDCRKILIYTNLLRFLAIVFLLLSPENVLAILEILFIISALSQIFTPAESTSIPKIVPKDQIISANSTVMTTTYATLLIGYGIAGPIMSLVGPKWLFFICGVLFVLSTIATYFLSSFDPKKQRRVTLINVAEGIERAWQETKSGLKYIKKSKHVSKPMNRLAIGWVIFGAFITILPAYAEQVLKISPKFIGPLIIGPAGIGMIAAASLLHRSKKKIEMKVINIGAFVVGSALLAFSLYQFYSNFLLAPFILLVCIFLLGFGSSIVQIPGQTMLHLNSDEDKRGRVFGISSMQLRLATALPALVIGGVADLTSSLVTMIFLAIMVFIYGLIQIFE